MFKIQIMKKHKIFLDMRKCSPEELKQLAKVLFEKGENVYSYTLYLLRKGRFWKGDPCLVFNHRNEWLPTGLYRTHEEVTFDELIKLLDDWED